MKRLFAPALAVALLAMPMAGCSTLQGIVNPASVHLKATQAELVLEDAFKGVGIALEAAVDSGALKGPAAAKARGLYEKAHTALLAARSAVSDGDKASQTLTGMNAILDINQLIATGGGYGIGPA